MTVEDVARAAGVSRQTVSRVLNEHPRVAPGTRNRVRGAMAELRWAPDPAARALGRRSPLRAVHPLPPGRDDTTATTQDAAAIAQLRAVGFRVVEVPAGAPADLLARLVALDHGPGVVVRVV